MILISHVDPLMFVLSHITDPMITISSTSSDLTPRGENATFVCTNSDPIFPTFIVTDEDGDTRLVLVRKNDEGELQERKIFQIYISDHEIILNVLASEMNNNTNITCGELTMQLFSTVLQVTVIG